MKTSELIERDLDYWAGRAYGKTNLCMHNGKLWEISQTGKKNPSRWRPSVNWTQGGPIIEREGITIEPNPYGMKLWVACSGPGPRDIEPHWIWKDGATALIAAMRCYVASKFGEEVDDSQAHHV